MIQKEIKEKQESDSAQRYITAKKQPRGFMRDYSSTPRKEQRRQRIQHKRQKPRMLNKHEIERLYQNLLDQSQYTQAQKAKATIKYLNDKQKIHRKRKLSEEHSAQKQKLKQFHDRQMKYFRQAWRQIFIQQSMKQRLMTQQLERLRFIDEQQCKQRIRKRCQSAKPVAVVAKLYQIEDTQRLLRKRGKTTQLKQIRQQKKKVVSQYKKQQQKILIKIAEQQKKKLMQKQTRRYKSFMHRIQQTQAENQKLYRRQQRKFKQKYQNMLRNIQHDQSRDLYNLQKSMNLNYWTSVN